MNINKHVNLTEIRTFVILAQAGSFTKAGEILNCSRSHISKQLNHLEKSLGVTLIIRTTRTQHLTAQGEAFFLRCKQSLQNIGYAIDNALESADSLSGHLKVNCVGGPIGEDIIAPLVNAFMKKYPDISLELDFSSRRVDLISGEFDFVFRMGELTDSSLVAKKLTDIHINTYVSPQYIADHGKPTDLKELNQHRCITGSMKQWAFVHNQTGIQETVTVGGSLSCKNGRIMVSSAIAGNGIIRVPETYCKAEVAQGLLVPLFSDWTVASTPFYLVFVQDQHQPTRIKVFKDFVSDYFIENSL